MSKLFDLPLWTFLAILPFSGCTLSRNEVHAPAPASGTERGVIFCVDGAGDFDATTAALRSEIAEQGLPLRVNRVAWSHGWCRVLADEMDYAHARAAGQRLAQQIVAYRRCHPDVPIYLVAHSAGSAVALSALEVVPPGMVEDLVLLAPSVSADYDLRLALRNVRCGIDLFYSNRDWFFLGIGIAMFGTADRRWSPASGRVGFHTIGTTVEDLALYGKLRQHPWELGLTWTGNLGGHYGTYREPTYLRTYVMPLFRPAATAALRGPCTQP
jgi:pimeloyl-ACP methyl ester carboxylesterase